jgi:hypothetical protein
LSSEKNEEMKKYEAEAKEEEWKAGEKEILSY